MMKELPLVHAASKGDVDTVRQLLADGHDVNEQAEPLTEKQLKTAKWIINEAGTDAAAEAVGRAIDITPLMAAIENDHLDVVDVLLEAGADVVRTDSLKRDALMIAIAWKQGEIAKRLLAAGADPNAKDAGGEPVLTQAISRGLYPLADQLLDAGAQAQPRAKKDCLPLLAAAHREDSTAGALIMRLLNEGAVVKAPDVLDLAVRNHPPDVLARIIRDFPKVLDKADPDGLLAAAGQRRDVDVIQALLDAGLEPQNSADAPSALSAVLIGPPRSSLDFHKPEYSDDERVIPCLEVLVAAGSDINQGGGIPLHDAVDFILPQACEWLIERGAEVNADRRGKTPIDSARESIAMLSRSVGHLKEVEPVDDESRSEIERDIATSERQLAKLNAIIKILTKAGGRSAVQDVDNDQPSQAEPVEPESLQSVKGVPVAQRRGLCDTGFSKVSQIMFKAGIDTVSRMFSKQVECQRIERDVYSRLDELKRPTGNVMALVKLKGHDWIYLAGAARWYEQHTLESWSKQIKGDLIWAGEESVSGMVYYSLFRRGECVETFESDGQWFRGGIEIDQDVDDEDDRRHGTNFTSSIHDEDSIDWDIYESEWQFLDAFFDEHDAYLTFMWAGYPANDKPLQLNTYHPDEADPEAIERVDLIVFKPTQQQELAASQPDPSTDSLLVAIQSFDLDAVSGALAAGADVNATPSGGRQTYLELAVGVESIGKGSGIVDALLEAGADPTGSLENPLLVKLIPNLFANPNAMRMMVKLLAAGANVNTAVKLARKNIFKADGQTALMKAAQSCQMNFIKLLLRHGADVQLADGNGKTALDYAGNWHREVRKDLVKDVPSFAEKGDEENAQAVVKLLEAASEGSLDLNLLPSDEELIKAEIDRKRVADRAR